LLVTWIDMTMIRNQVEIIVKEMHTQFRECIPVVP